MTGALTILLLVAAQRVIELGLAQRNTRRLLAAGAVEIGAGHYPLIVVLHAAWLATLAFVAWDSPVNLWLLAVFVVLQGLRIWVIATLGPRWTTRIVVVPRRCADHDGSVPIS